jgi:hypothetical protein
VGDNFSFWLLGKGRRRETLERLMLFRVQWCTPVISALRNLRSSWATLKYPFHPLPPNSHIQGKVEDKVLKNSPPSCVLFQVLCPRNIKVIFMDGNKSHVLTSVQWMKLWSVDLQSCLAHD